MDENELDYKRGKNFVSDKIFTDDDKMEIEDNKYPKNSTFNLEYHKITNIHDSHKKFNEELQNLIDFVKERNYYRDIYGNRIISKGKLLPTPYQKIEKMNQEIRNYYEKKANRKNSPLMVKNEVNKDLVKNNDERNINNFTNRFKIFNKKIYHSSNKDLKTYSRTNYNKILNNPKSIYYNNLRKNKYNSVEHNTVTQNSKEVNTESSFNNKDNNVCLSEILNNRKVNYFSQSRLYQDNSWKSKFSQSHSLNKNNNKDNLYLNKSKYNLFITEYNKRNQKNFNNMLIRINKYERSNNNLSKNKKIFKLNDKSKTKDFNQDLNRYNLIQFNLNKLVKPDEKKKEKIILTMRRPKDIYMNENMKNKTVNMKMMNTDDNKFSTFKSSSFKNYNYTSRYTEEINRDNLVKEPKFIKYKK